MNVFYNYELDDTVELKATPEGMAYLEKLKQFVVQRLIVLKEDIEKEEQSETKLIVIYIPEQGVNFQGLIYSGYSKELTAKMKSCFSIEDIEYLQRSFNNYNFGLN